jgi:hypothetical protein
MGAGKCRCCALFIPSWLQCLKKLNDMMVHIGQEHRAMHGGVSKVGKEIDRVCECAIIHFCYTIRWNKLINTSLLPRYRTLPAISSVLHAMTKALNAMQLYRRLSIRLYPIICCQSDDLILPKRWQKSVQ